MRRHVGFTAGCWWGGRTALRRVWPHLSPEGRAEAESLMAEMEQALDRPAPPPDTLHRQLQRRRAAALRCEPLEDGRRDPLDRDWTGLRANGFGHITDDLERLRGTA